MEISPKFSFIIPCWEQTHLLKCLLQSIVCQTYDNWEVILVHDGVNLSHKQQLNEFLTDKRFKYNNTPQRYGFWGHKGRSLGTSFSSGDWIIHSNDDNYFIPIILEEIVNAINDNPEVNFICWDMVLGKYHNQHSHNKRDYGHFVPKIQHSYIDWGQFTTKKSVISKYHIQYEEAAADGSLVESMKHELNPFYIDKVMFIHN
jgi:glycosyltransferase involved in cell wall biosynthesis